MKITGFVGSPRKKGNTDLLVRRILEGASEKGADTDIIYLNDLKIRDCQACNHCRKNPMSCSVNDDMIDLFPLIESSDVVILGSPIYMGYITGLMKTFLDRWQAFGWQAFDGKKGPSARKHIFLVLPYARPEEDVFEYVAEKVGQSLKYVFGAKVNSLLVNKVGAAGSVLQKEDVMQQAWEIGAALVEE